MNNDQKLENLNTISMFAIVVGATILGFYFGGAIGWGVGLIAYGLRNAD